MSAGELTILVMDDQVTKAQIGEFPETIGQMRFQNPGKNSLSTIIGGYKSSVSNNMIPAGVAFERVCENKWWWGP